MQSPSLPRAGFAGSLACAIALLAAACGGNVNVTGGSGGSGAAGAGGSTTTSAGGAAAGGDCQTKADCPSPGDCVAVTPGGYKICLSFPPEATECTNGMPIQDKCCKTADCPMGKCYLSSDVPQCGGFQPTYNDCVSDACASDADCGASALCAPAGAYGPVRRCVPAYCKTNADCSTKPGGVCAPIANPCCALTLGLACVYPGGCKQQADCKSNQSCAIDPATKSAACTDQFPGCPL